MKNIKLLILCAVLFSAGCTSPEQDQQIKQFWMEQYVNLMAKYTAGMERMEANNSQQAAKSPLMRVLQNLKHNPAPQPQPKPAAVPAKPRPAAPALPQMLEVSMEQGALPGKAPEADRLRMKQAWNEVQLNNHAILQDVQTMFGEDIKVKAFLITAQTEATLKQEAANAADFKTYLARQTQILEKQENALQQLMMQNKTHIKPLKN